MQISGQTAMIVGAAILFSLLLFLFFNTTLIGKALQATAVNRVGARLVGIRPEPRRHDRLPDRLACSPPSPAC